MQIAAVGDYHEEHETHTAIGSAVEHAASALGAEASVAWLPTPDIEGRADAALQAYDGIWIAPGSPYQSMQGALDAIGFARTHNVPLLGTCAGFQHIVIEFARSVLGIADAQHAEYDPTAPRLMISPLSCSLRGKVMDVRITPGSRAQAAYGATRASERYYCEFGLNPDYVDRLIDGGLVISGSDQDGEPRIIELPSLQFFIGTLFVPQTSSAPGAPHPLIKAYVAAVYERSLFAGHGSWAGSSPTSLHRSLPFRRS